MTENQPTSNIESEHLAALRAAVHVGVSDIEAGNYETVSDTASWVDEISKTVTTESVA